MSLSRRAIRRLRELQARSANDPTRRDFLRAAGCAALTTTSIISTVWDLRIINAAAADQIKVSANAAADPFKALVCIFLYGGNDANNLIVPTDGRYYNYASIRGNLALPLTAQLPGQNPIRPITVKNTPGQSYGLHPACLGSRNDSSGNPQISGLCQLFAENKLALLANVGTLIKPMTKAEWQNGSKPRPYQLFSHADQQVQWQTSVSDRPTRTGWGGRCADLLYSLNGNNTVSMSMSLSGANIFEVGNVVNQLSVSTNGAVALSNVSASQKAAMQDILNMQYGNLYESTFATITNRAINSADAINAAIAATRDSGSPSPAPWTWNMPFLNNNLGNQLKMIARLIQARAALGHTRQIYFASVGGYDLHSGQIVTGDPTTGAHANLFLELSEGMFSFQRAMEQLGLADQVVTFTMSDFGRTLPTNGQGSDHGWGNHQLVMGGSGGTDGIVKGGNLFGTFPIIANNSSDDLGTGRWIPTTSVDQYSATLAKWFGVSDGLMPTVFPNIGNFATSDLGFINTAAAATAVPASAGSTRRAPTRTPTR
jgi:uncharacterized protein (DUF1501 family)